METAVTSEWMVIFVLLYDPHKPHRTCLKLAQSMYLLLMEAAEPFWLRTNMTPQWKWEILTNTMVWTRLV